MPWYKGFTGRIVPVANDANKYESRGIVRIIDNGNEDTVEITELPIKTWTQTYKEKIIEPLFDGSDKRPQILQDYKEYHTDTTVHFVCKMRGDELTAAERKGLYDVFALKSSINITNMVRNYTFYFIVRIKPHPSCIRAMFRGYSKKTESLFIIVFVRKIFIGRRVKRTFMVGTHPLPKIP